MTRKSKKGIIGKKTPTFYDREKVGIGLSFSEEHISYSDEIEKKIKEKKRKK